MGRGGGDGGFPTDETLIVEVEGVEVRGALAFKKSIRRLDSGGAGISPLSTCFAFTRLPYILLLASERSRSTPPSKVCPR